MEIKLKTMKNPTSHLTEVLHHLINYKKASVKEFFWMSGFRTRISDLKLIYGINFETEQKFFVSKHGNKSSYNIHKLPDSSIKKAISIYNKLVK